MNAADGHGRLPDEPTTPDSARHPGVAGTIIIPAHDEERSIGRLLDQLLDGSAPGPFEILVVCNGCTDGTAAAARRPGVVVVELTEPSKAAAIVFGDELAHHYPRVVLDADVEITGVDVGRLMAAVSVGPALASGPRRRIPRRGVQRVVRWYYDVWEELPVVRSGLFGRGVIALSEDAYQRVRSLPSAMADDLVLSEAFTPDERVVVADATVTIHPPKTVRDLMRRRVRVSTGNAQADRIGLRTGSARTSLGDVAGVVRHRPALAGKALVYLAVVLGGRFSARRAVRRGDYSTWHRDQSSRE